MNYLHAHSLSEKQHTRSRIPSKKHLWHRGTKAAFRNKNCSDSSCSFVQKGNKGFLPLAPTIHRNADTTPTPARCIWKAKQASRACTNKYKYIFRTLDSTQIPPCSFPPPANTAATNNRLHFALCVSLRAPAVKISCLPCFHIFLLENFSLAGQKWRREVAREPRIDAAGGTREIRANPPRHWLFLVSSFPFFFAF